MDALSIRDKKIIMMLDEDSTIPNSQIGKKLKISKETVAYRIKQLEKKGIIVNYITLSHFAKTGLIHFKLYIQYRQISKTEAEEIVKFLSVFPNIGWLASTEGIFDLMFSMRFPNIYEFEDFKDEFCRRYDKHFASIQIAILTEAETKPRLYILNEDKQARVFLHCDKAEPEKLDEEDRKILSAIAINARAPAHSIADELGVTPRVVRYRRKQLEKRGIIVGYKLSVDYRKLGYLFFKCFVSFRNLTDDTYASFRQYLRTHPNVIYWIKTIGTWDAEIEIEVPSVEEFYVLVSEIKEQYGSVIQRIESSLVSKEHKIKHS